MPSAYAATIRAREKFTRETLGRLKERSSALRASLVEATAAVKAAQAVVDALENERYEVDNQCSLLENVLDSTPRAFDPQIMQRLPTEMLHTIFAFVVSRPDPDWQAPLVVDNARCSAPFLLASVCKRWRGVALSSSSLWTYIGVPDLFSDRQSENDFHAARVKLLLQRSNSQPLDVAIDWDTSSSWPDERNFPRIVAAIGRHMSRLRRLQFYMPPGITLDQVQFLRNPAPLLEHLYIYSADERMLPLPPENDHISTFLPQSPLLRELSSGTIFVIPRRPLLRLVRADLMLDNYPASSIWAALQMMPALEELRLTFLPGASGLGVVGGIIDAPTTPLTLPALRCLDLQGRSPIVLSWATMLKLPALDEMVVHGGSLGDTAFREFCLAVCSRAKRLTLDCVLQGQFEATQPLQLPAIFPNLRQLCAGVLIPPSLLVFLEDSTRWPTLDNFELHHCWLGGHAADMLLRVARNRCHERDRALAPFRITLNCCGVSPWFPSQAALLVGDKLTLDVVEDWNDEEFRQLQRIENFESDGESE